MSTSIIGSFFLAYLLSTQFTDQAQFSVSPVDNLVSYQYNTDFQNILPGIRYNGSVHVQWAVPDSAIAGLDGKSIIIKVSGTASNSSSVSFLIPPGMESKETAAFLVCNVVNGTCSNTSILSADIPVVAFANESTTEATITMKSEILEAIPSDLPAEIASHLPADIIQNLPSLSLNFSLNTSNMTNISSLQDDLVSTLQSLFATTASSNSANSASANASSTPNETSLVYEIQGQSQNSVPDVSGQAPSQESPAVQSSSDSTSPMNFLHQNPLIALGALILVIVITGSYLLSSKD